MNSSLRQKLDLFVSNSLKVKEKMRWQTAFNTVLISMLYTMEDREVDCDKIIDIQNYIRDNTGIFSVFRGVMSVSFSSLLSLSDDFETTFIDTDNVSKMMKERGFLASEHLLFAAYQIVANEDPANFLRVVERSRTFYLEMKKTHRFYTGADDYVSSVMLALSGKDIEYTINNMEDMFQKLKPEFQKRNDLQALTQILALSNDSESLFPKLFAMRDAFKEKKLRIDKAYVLPLLGILALLPVDIDTIVEEVSSIYEELKNIRYFRWNLPKFELLIISAALVSDNHISEAKNTISNIMTTGLTSLAISQSVAILTAASAGNRAY